jgi:hypothetical protein
MGEEQERPKAIWSGSFTVGGVEIKCHVLDDGQRVIEPESLTKLFEEADGKLSGVEEFTAWCKAKD